MIIRLEQKEMGALLLHMSIMRKNVRKGFKSNYKGDSKKVLKSYDEVKETLTQALESNGTSWSDLHFNIKEVEMLHSFLSFYTKEIDRTFLDKKLSVEDQQQIDSLHEVKIKVDEMILSYA